MNVNDAHFGKVVSFNVHVQTTFGLILIAWLNKLDTRWFQKNLCIDMVRNMGIVDIVQMQKWLAYRSLHVSAC